MCLVSVCSAAKLPAAAGHSVVRRFPRLEETTLGRQTGDLLHHRTAVPSLLTGKSENETLSVTQKFYLGNKSKETEDRINSKSSGSNATFSFYVVIVFF